MYRFTRRIPAEATIYTDYPAWRGEQQTTTKEVVYTGRELVIWQDEQQRIALRPAPSPQTQSRGLPAPPAPLSGSRLQIPPVADANDPAPADTLADPASKEPLRVRQEVLLDESAVARASVTVSPENSAVLCQ
jgi:hypothetical protein